MTTGNVSIRLSIQDAETVRVALEKLGTDGAAALKKIDAASSHPSAGLGALDKGVSEAKSSLKELSSELGPVGSLLMGLGPIGIAAAVGLGGALLVMHEMSKAANELAERAESIQNFATATGATTTEVQALVAEGSRFGLSAEQISTGLQRMSVNLESAKRGTGQLYEDLHRIDPALAHQVAAAKDTAQAYDLIGQAIARAEAAKNTSQANEIARAAFGRNAGNQGALAADVSSQGGLASMAASFQAAGKALDDGLLKKLTELKNQIDQTNQRAKDIGASIFAEETLQRALSMAQVMERMAAAAKEMHDATKDESWGDFFKRKLTELGAFGAGEGGNFELAGQMQEDARRAALEAHARSRLATSMASGQQTDPSGAWQPAGRGGQGDAVKAVGDAAKATQVPIEAVLADTNKWMAALGAAATPAERLAQEILRLNVAVKDHTASSQVAARALAQFKDAQTETSTSTRERLGLASQEEIISARLIQIKHDEADGYIKSEAEKQAAIARTTREAELAFRQEQINNSAFKGLAGMAHPDANAAVDQLATTQLNAFDTTLVRVINHQENAADAWRKFGLNAIEAIEQTIVKMLILAPIAKGLESILTGGVGGLPKEATGAGVSPFAMGGIMTPRGALPLHFYEGGGVASGPQMAIFGEGRQNEAYVPLPDGRAIPVNLKGGGGASTVSHSVNVNVNVSGARGSQEIKDAANAGAAHAIAVSAALINSSNENLSFRMMRNDQRGI